MAVISITTSTTHTSDTTLDLGNKDSGPCRPILTEYKKIKFGTQQRSFRGQWYNECNWLEYSVQRNAAFCFVCQTFGSENSGENVWIKSGFNNLQKFLVKSKKHISTSTHLTNLSKMCAYKSSLKTGTVVTQLSSFHKKQVEINRKYMSSLIDVVLYLAKQGIAFRGHNENLDSLNQGNVPYGIFKVKFMPDLKNVYENKINHTSWKVQDGIIKISADLIKEIVVSGNFALMVDEARSHKEEQLSVCVRYAVGLEARERFLQFIDVSNGQTASHIISAVFNCFQNLSININTLNIVAQSYDGASVMSGHLGGIRSKIKQQFPCAIYTHCMAHRLNLIVVDMCKGIKRAQSIFNTLEMVYVHFSRPSNNTKLNEVQSKLGLKKGNSMIKNYSSILEFLKNEVEAQMDKDAIEAIGILGQIQNCAFFIGVTLLKDILGIINIISVTLQSKNATLGKAKTIINGSIQSIEKLRSDIKFSTFWQKITSLAEENDITLEIPHIGRKRIRTQPKSLNNFYLQLRTGEENEPNITLSVEDYWRQNLYYPIIDSIIVNLKYRFSKESLSMACPIDNFMNMNSEGSLEFINNYKNVTKVSIDLLKAEIMVFKNCLPPNFNFDNIKGKINKEAFPNLYKLLQIAITIPISSATCEYSFSSMRRIKNWLRTSMLQQHFSDLSILNIERDLSNKIQTETVLDRFNTKTRKIVLK
ncbi:hypothetical protein QTP88_008853 [Uroleucon formosanum]